MPPSQNTPLQISRLLAEAFASYESLDDETPQASRASVLQYQLKLLAALQWRASTLGRGLVSYTHMPCSGPGFLGTCLLAGEQY